MGDMEKGVQLNVQIWLFFIGSMSQAKYTEDAPLWRGRNKSWQDLLAISGRAISRPITSYGIITCCGQMMGRVRSYSM